MPENASMNENTVNNHDIVDGRDPPRESGWYDFTAHVGAALKLMRFQKRMRQDELAQALSEGSPKRVDQSDISKIENSRKGVSLERLGLICKHLNCLPSQVLATAEFLAIQSNRPPANVRGDVLRAVDQQLATMSTSHGRDRDMDP